MGATKKPPLGLKGGGRQCKATKKNSETDTEIEKTGRQRRGGELPNKGLLKKTF